MDDPYQQVALGIYSQSPVGSIGLESGRNYLNRAPINNVDLSVEKGFGLGGRRRLAFRVDAFNALNHTQFDAVANNIQFQASATTPSSTCRTTRPARWCGPTGSARSPACAAPACCSCWAGSSSSRQQGPALSGAGRWRVLVQTGLDSACPDELRSLDGSGSRCFPARSCLMPMRKIDLTSFQVATSETARQINRRIALSLIRRHEPLSRADLARRSGLQRSTVSAIIDELIVEGWVNEGELGLLPRGRRPRFLHVNTDRVGTIGVELRPDLTTVGLAGLDAKFKAQEQWNTPATPEAFAAPARRDGHRAPQPVPGDARRRRRRQPARPRRRARPPDVRAQSRLAGDGPAGHARIGHRPARLPRERRQRLRPRRALVRQASRTRPQPRRRHGVGRHRRRPPDQRPAGTRRQRDGRRARPRDARRKGPALQVRQARLLGALRLQFGRGDGLLARHRRRGVAGVAGRRRPAGAVPLARRARPQRRPRALAAIDRMAHFLGSGLSFIITALAPR